MPKKKALPPKEVWLLFDKDGELFDRYNTQDAAWADAVGPRFWPHCSVRMYRLVPLKDTPKLREPRVVQIDTEDSYKAFRTRGSRVVRRRS